MNAMVQSWWVVDFKKGDIIVLSPQVSTQYYYSKINPLYTNGFLQLIQ